MATIKTMKTREQVAWQMFTAMAASPVLEIDDGRPAAKVAFKLTDDFLAVLDLRSEEEPCCAEDRDELTVARDQLHHHLRAWERPASPPLVGER